jgi:hypothetical protein
MLARYPALIDQGSRTSARVRVLHELERLAFVRPPGFHVRRVDAAGYQDDPAVRGALQVHVDLMFRSSLSAAEIAYTARHGLIYVAHHPAVPWLPIAVAMAAVGECLVERRDQLFALRPTARDGVTHVMPFAVAANPGRIGAGRAVLRGLLADCAAWSPPPRVTTFSPLTGLRALVMGCVHDARALRQTLVAEPEIDRERLRDQLDAVLETPCHPAAIAEPARRWLARRAELFAGSDGYAVGAFHRAMGAALSGVVERGDGTDADALWWRAWFDYGPAAAAAAGLAAVVPAAAHRTGRGPG